MKRLKMMNKQSMPLAAALALSLSSGPALAIDYYLAAKAYTKSLPDGSTVPMWGYVNDPDNDSSGQGDCWEAASNGARMACINALPDPSFPGPELDVPPALSALRVFLSNGLPEPTSLIITGLELPFSANAGGPTWDDGNSGARSNPNQRVRSFGLEAGANGGRRPYVWNNGRSNPIDHPGSFIYQSGTWPQKQVYMGLAGLVAKDNAANEVYPGVSYDNEVVLFYSDIDPDFNTAVISGTLGTAINRHPRWFLINGEPYETGLGDINSGSAGPLSASTNTLLRLASTASDNHVVVVQGMEMKIHAEDGQQYNWQDAGGLTSHPAPRMQYSTMLPPAKTKDAIIVAPANARYAVYDGNGYMTNPSDPNNEAVGDTVGGMIRFLSFGSGTNNVPIAVNDAASVVAGFSINIGVLTNDSDPEGDPLSIASATAASAGSVSCQTNVVAGVCSYDASGVPAGTIATFSYIVTDGSSSSAPATVSISVTANQVPTATNDSASTDQDVAVVIPVTVNDSDPEGQTLSVANFDALSAGGQNVSCAGSSCTYTPSGGFTSAGDTFTYSVSDGLNESTAATVTVAVLAPNLAPTAVNDPNQTTPINTQIVIDVLANDTDPEGNPLSIAAFDSTSTQGGTVACVTNGSCTYTPPSGFTGTDTFTYSVSDGLSTSNTATVTIEVTPAGAPVLFFSTLGAGSVPGVSGPFDDGDVYTVDSGNTFERLFDAVSDLGLPNNANIDGLSVDANRVYVSFARASTSVPGLGIVPDEDVVYFDTSDNTWHPYFDGSICGLDASNGQDIDALSVVGSLMYFSTAGGGANNSVAGVTGPTGDDADIYTWNQGATTCARAVDATADWGVPGSADVNGLTVIGSSFYVSFLTDTTVGGVVFQDTDIAVFDGTNWSLHFNGGSQGLSANGSQDLDAIHVVTTSP